MTRRRTASRCLGVTSLWHALAASWVTALKRTSDRSQGLQPRSHVPRPGSGAYHEIFLMQGRQQAWYKHPCTSLTSLEALRWQRRFRSWAQRRSRRRLGDFRLPNGAWGSSSSQPDRSPSMGSPTCRENSRLPRFWALFAMANTHRFANQDVKTTWLEQGSCR